MISLLAVSVILLWHWIADFVFQTDEQAKNKSSSWEALFEHTIIYSISWLIPIVFLGHHLNSLDTLSWFIPITFIAHTAQDYYTSRVNKILWDDKNVHGFFVSIGFDQLLHYLQLFITFKLLY